MMGTGESMRNLLFTFLLMGSLSCLSGQQGGQFVSSSSVTTPALYVNGKKVTGGAVTARGTDVISVKASTGETIILSFSYLAGHRKFNSDLRDGPITAEQADNINIGAFAKSPAGTIWIVSFYAQKSGRRGETEVVVLTRGEDTGR